jgi:hypothetical protein
MGHRFIVALITLSLTAAPAFAQSMGTTGSGRTASPGGATPNSAAENNAGAANSPTENSTAAPGSSADTSGLQTPTSLTQSLQQAGFRNIRVSASSFVVHATGPNGSPVVMMITPDRVTGVIGSPQSAQAPNSPSEQQQNGASQRPGGSQR